MRRSLHNDVWKLLTFDFPLTDREKELLNFLFENQYTDQREVIQAIIKTNDFYTLGDLYFKVSGEEHILDELPRIKELVNRQLSIATEPSTPAEAASEAKCIVDRFTVEANTLWQSIFDDSTQWGPAEYDLHQCLTKEISIEERTSFVSIIHRHCSILLQERLTGKNIAKLMQLKQSGIDDIGLLDTSWYTVCQVLKGPYPHRVALWLILVTIHGKLRKTPIKTLLASPPMGSPSTSGAGLFGSPSSADDYVDTARTIEALEKMILTPAEETPLLKKAMG